MCCLVLMICSVTAQNITRINVAGDICLSYNVCVETVDTNAAIATKYFLREGRVLWIGNQVFICTNSTKGMGAKQIGPTRVNGQMSAQTWIVPVYTGNDNEIVFVNKIIRVVGVPANFIQKSTKVYQVLHRDTIAFVFYLNGELKNYIRNPGANYRYTKNTNVVICYAE